VAKKKTQPRRDWRMMFFIVLSLLIVLSMVLAYAIPAFN
jgi:predicted nucleic acid-binding Zn ribbon protein